MRFAKFAGLNNVLSWERQTALVRSKGDEPAHFLETATNVYLDDSGRIARRDGVTELVAGAAHSLWSDGDICLYAQGGSLKRLWDDDTSTTLRTDLSGDPVSYRMIGETVYYSDNTITGMYDPHQVVEGWGVGEPPLLTTSVISGNLPTGRYGYVATFRDQMGREGGAVNFGMIELSEIGGIRFDSPDLGDNMSALVYVTPANGDVYYLLSELSLDGHANYVEQEYLILSLNNAHKGQPPAGHIVSHYRGHMLVAQGPWVFYSDPYQYHLFGHNNYMPFEGRVTLVAPVSNGIFVATKNKTVFLSGESPTKMAVVHKANHGAIEGTLTFIESSDIGGLDKVPSQTVAIWASAAGICIGGNDGLFINLTESRYKFDEVSDRGASVLLQMGDSNQLITSI